MFKALGMATLAACATGAAPADHGPAPGLIWSLPFAALLGAVAILPMVPAAHHWWERNRNKLLVSVALGAIALGHYAARGWGYHGSAPGFAAVRAVLDHAILGDYVPFIALLLALYVIAGGVELRGDLRAWPGVNTGLLGFGAVLANLIGTTGASMVLIRAVLQTNRDRTHVAHTVVFFIFLVSNIGGCLLPIGDPPLFLGYLKGVPFLWTTTLALPWFATVASVLAVYYVWDRVMFAREPGRNVEAEGRDFEPVRVRGWINLAWMVAAVLAVALVVPGRPLPGSGVVVPPFAREAILLGLAGLSIATTPRGLRRDSEFTYGPIAEVACLFLGIFLTMQPPLEILQARGGELPIDTPARFFWATGGLSGVLDNAPTYLVFFEAAKALNPDPGAGGEAGLVRLMDGSTIRADLLAAISLGAVFMGALTYIGNGPNFMVKAIAERRGVAMPGFFGYLGYSLVVLLPIFGAITLLFFGTGV